MPKFLKIALTALFLVALAPQAHALEPFGMVTIPQDQTPSCMYGERSSIEIQFLANTIGVQDYQLWRLARVISVKCTPGMENSYTARDLLGDREFRSLGDLIREVKGAGDECLKNQETRGKCVH